MPALKIDADVVILAGDVAWNYGLAMGHAEEGLLGSIGGSVEKYRGKHGIAKAVLKLAEETRAFGERFVTQVDLAVYEEPTMHKRSTNKLPQYAAVTGFLIGADALGARHDVLREWPSRLKKKITGCGNAEKSDMMAAASEWAGRPIENHDEADAVLLLKVAIEQYLERATW